MDSQNLNVEVAKFMKGACSERELETSCRGTLLKMLETGLHADITMKAAGGTVQAHRSVLATLSPVFKAMFASGMREELTSSVEMPDITIEALELFLFLLYAGIGCNVKESLVGEHCVELMEACHKYQVSHLVPIFTEAMKRTMTDENCWDYFDKSNQLLQRGDGITWRGPWSECTLYIQKNFARVVETDSFVRAIKDHPELVVVVTRLVTRASKSR